jgi:hypothetical protein
LRLVVSRTVAPPGRWQSNNECAKGRWTKCIFGLVQLLGFFGIFGNSDADRLAYVEESGQPARELRYDPNIAGARVAVGASRAQQRAAGADHVVVDHHALAGDVRADARDLGALPAQAALVGEGRRDL